MPEVATWSPRHSHTTLVAPPKVQEVGWWGDPQAAACRLRRDWLASAFLCLCCSVVAGDGLSMEKTDLKSHCPHNRQQGRAPTCWPVLT